MNIPAAIILVLNEVRSSWSYKAAHTHFPRCCNSSISHVCKQTLPNAGASPMQALATGKPPPKKSAHRVGVLIFLVEARRIELLSENESKRLSSSVVTNLSYRLKLLPVTESALHYSVNFPGGDTDLSPWVANYLTLFQPRRRQAGRTATYLLSSD